MSNKVDLYYFFGYRPVYENKMIMKRSRAD